MSRRQKLSKGHNGDSSHTFYSFWGCWALELGDDQGHVKSSRKYIKEYQAFRWKPSEDQAFRWKHLHKLGTQWRKCTLGGKRSYLEGRELEDGVLSKYLSLGSARNALCWAVIASFAIPSSWQVGTCTYLRAAPYLMCSQLVDIEAASSFYYI